MIALATPRLVLRPWTADDMAGLTDLCPGEGVPGPDFAAGVVPPVDVQALTLDNERRWLDERLGSLAIEHELSLIGCVGVRHSERAESIRPPVAGGGPVHELLWRLAPSARGRGFATEASGAMMDWAFSERGLTMLVALIPRDDTASQGVAQRLGMTLHRSVLVEGLEEWLKVYRMDRKTWASS